MGLEPSFMELVPLQKVLNEKAPCAEKQALPECTLYQIRQEWASQPPELRVNILLLFVRSSVCAIYYTSLSPKF